MTEAKRGRGRPKKEQRIENPDCAPATKGFVKCLMRKYDEKHTHEQTSGGALMFCLSLVFGAVWLGMVCKPGAVDPVYMWMAGAFVIVTMAAAYEFECLGSYRTIAPNGGVFDRPPKYLDAYVEPKPECEPKKKGCE